MFSCEFCEISKSTFFTEHLRATAFILSLKKYLDLNANVKQSLEGKGKALSPRFACI